MQGERNAKFICAFPSRSLISSLRSKDKVSASREKYQIYLSIPGSFYHAIPIFAPLVSKKVLFLAWQGAAVYGTAATMTITLTKTLCRFHLLRKEK